MKKITTTVILLFTVAVALSQTITVELLTDAYASETRWGILDSNDNLIAQNATLANETSVTTNVNVTTTECYRFVILDSYGDGIAGYNGSAPGSLSVSYNGVYVGGFTTANSGFGSRFVVYGIGEGCHNVDAKMSAINQVPFAAAGDISITCTVENTGLNNLTSFDVNYRVDNGAVVTQNVTGVNLSIGDRNEVTFTTPWAATTGDYTITAWVSNANASGNDEDLNNDSKELGISIASQATQRLPLYEEFTSSTCGPCAGFNTNNFNDAFLAANTGNYSLIKYQMNWPGVGGDPYYTAEGGVRRDYYSVTGVPTLALDGVDDNPNFFQNTAQLQPVLNQVNAKPAFFTMAAIHSVHALANEVVVEVDIDPYLSGDYVLHAALIEGRTTANVATNGETYFTDVMMKMIPDANGTAVTFTEGAHLKQVLTASLVGTHIEEMSDLKVVVFIQHNASKSVMQSVTSTENATAAVDNYIFEAVSIYPNPTKGKLNIKTDREINLSFSDMLGRVVFVKDSIREETTLDLSNLEKGIYIVSIFDGAHKGTQKIIIE